MRIAVVTRDGPLDFDLADDRVVGHGNGPIEPATPPDLTTMARSAIAEPLDFPPLARAIVPGDRVAIPVAPALPGLAEVLGVMVGAIREAGADSITVVATGPGSRVGPSDGVEWVVHDSADQNGIAYLANTKEGRRVYLNRQLTDADIVVPIGPLGYDPALGYRGPWSVLYPGLSDRDTQARFRTMAVDDPPDRDRPRPGFAEAAEVSWLLGCQFQVGVVPGLTGPIRLISGLDATVREAGPAAVDAAWSIRCTDRADLVVAGIGTPGQPSTIDDLSRGLAVAARAARRGGKIVVLARVDDEAGTALLRLGAADDPRSALGNLRGLEDEPDYLAARRVAAAVAWADVYLNSNLDADLVDGLGMIALDRPEDARKLATRAASSSFLGQADRLRVVIEGDDANGLPTPDEPS